MFRHGFHARAWIGSPKQTLLAHRPAPAAAPARRLSSPSGSIGAATRRHTAAPATAPISDVFGTQRVFNGKTQSSHLGLDFRVPSGTPVAAMNAGTVLLARPLYFEGNCVVLDHGQGLLTIYMHLSEFKVKEGEQVARGQEVGLSGGTGRATGPHLHVAVRWQGTYLDPAVLIKLPLP